MEKRKTNKIHNIIKLSEKKDTDIRYWAHYWQCKGVSPHILASETVLRVINGNIPDEFVFPENFRDSMKQLPADAQIATLGLSIPRELRLKIGDIISYIGGNYYSITFASFVKLCIRTQFDKNILQNPNDSWKIDTLISVVNKINIGSLVLRKQSNEEQKNDDRETEKVNLMLSDIAKEETIKTVYPEANSLKITKEDDGVQQDIGTIELESGAVKYASTTEKTLKPNKRLLQLGKQ